MTNSKCDDLLNESGTDEARKDVAATKSCCHKQAETANSSVIEETPPLNIKKTVSSHSCCGHTASEHTVSEPSDIDDSKEHSCCQPKQRVDWMLWGSLSVSAFAYLLHLAQIDFGVTSVHTLAHSVFELLNTMWFSLLLAFVFVGVLSQVPQSLVISILGRGGSVSGLIRATLAGVLMDLCSHGILMVGMKLYQKGASLGQTMAFLVASPWNSFSLTLILFALIGWQWTLAFIALSMVLAIITGWIFDQLVASKKLPANPVAAPEISDVPIKTQFREAFQSITWNRSLMSTLWKESVSGSRIVLRWLLFGVVLASLIRAFIDPETFQQWLGPTALGLAVTLIAATVIEVCSEGSAPIAADIMNRTSAPGNGFAFLMAGVATDYTEVMVIKDTMSSWKIALFLPLITVPQVIVVAVILNGFV